MTDHAYRSISEAGVAAHERALSRHEAEEDHAARDQQRWEDEHLGGSPYRARQQRQVLAVVSDLTGHTARRAAEWDVRRALAGRMSEHDVHSALVVLNGNGDVAQDADGRVTVTPQGMRAYDEREAA